MRRAAKSLPGVASFYLVIFATLVFGIVTLSFTNIILTETQRSSSSDLSQSAYDAALAGIEDAKTLLGIYNTCKADASGTISPFGYNCSELVSKLEGSGSTIGLFDSAPCDIVPQALGRTTEEGEVIIQEDYSGTESDPNALDEAYTCVKINRGEEVPKYYGYLSPNEPTRIIPMSSIDAKEAVGIKVYWERNSESQGKRSLLETCFGGCKVLPLPSLDSQLAISGRSSTVSAQTAIPPITVEVFQTDEEFSLYELDTNKKVNGKSVGSDHVMAMLYPSTTGFSNAVGTVTGRGSGVTDFNSCARSYISVLVGSSFLSEHRDYVDWILKYHPELFEAECATWMEDTVDETIANKEGSKETNLTKEEILNNLPDGFSYIPSFSRRNQNGYVYDQRKRKVISVEEYVRMVNEENAANAANEGTETAIDITSKKRPTAITAKNMLYLSDKSQEGISTAKENDAATADSRATFKTMMAVDCTFPDTTSNDSDDYRCRSIIELPPTYKAGNNSITTYTDQVLAATNDDRNGVDKASLRNESTFLVKISLPYGMPSTAFSVELCLDFVDGECITSEEYRARKIAEDEAAIKSLLTSMSKDTDIMKEDEVQISALDATEAWYLNEINQAKEAVKPAEEKSALIEDIAYHAKAIDEFAEENENVEIDEESGDQFPIDNAKCNPVVLRYNMTVQYEDGLAYLEGLKPEDPGERPNGTNSEKLREWERKRETYERWQEEYDNLIKKGERGIRITKNEAGQYYLEFENASTTGDYFWIGTNDDGEYVDDLMDAVDVDFEKIKVTFFGTGSQEKFVDVSKFTICLNQRVHMIEDAGNYYEENVIGNASGEEISGFLGQLPPTNPIQEKDADGNPIVAIADDPCILNPFRFSLDSVAWYIRPNNQSTMYDHIINDSPTRDAMMVSLHGNNSCWRSDTEINRNNLGATIGFTREDVNNLLSSSEYLTLPSLNLKYEYVQKVAIEKTKELEKLKTERLENIKDTAVELLYIGGTYNEIPDNECPAIPGDTRFDKNRMTFADYRKNFFCRDRGRIGELYDEIERLKQEVKDNHGFNGVQAMIDSTGRAGNSYRRVVAYVDLIPTTASFYPDNAVTITGNSPTIKNFYVTKNCGWIDNGGHSDNYNSSPYYRSDFVGNCRNTNYGDAGT